MPRSVVLVYRNKIDDADVAKETLLREQREKEEKFGRDFASFVDKMKKAESASAEEKQKNTFVGPEYYKSRAVDCIEDYQHELTLDYRLGLIPKEYFMERLYQLNILKTNFDYKPQLPSLFTDSFEGNFEMNKVVYTRMMGGYRKNWNKFTPEMFAMMPASSKAAYENEELVFNAYMQERNKIKEVENEEDRVDLDLDDFNLSVDNIPAEEDDLVATYTGPLDYKRAFNVEYRKMTKEEVDQFNEDCDIFVTAKTIGDELTKLENALHNSFKNEQEEKAFTKALANSKVELRLNQLQSTYLVWAMGMENMSFEQAINSIEGNGPDPKAIERFKKCYVDNQVLNKLDDPEGLKKAVENHVKMLKNAMEKLKEFKIPDIDYMDLKAKGDKSMMHYYKQFYALASIGVDMNQDLIQHVLLEPQLTKAGAGTIAIDAAGGIDKFNEITSFWRNMQFTTDLFDTAYGDVKNIDTLHNLDNPLYRANIKSSAGRKKSADYFLRQRMQRIKGKTLGELTDTKDSTLLVESKAINSVVTFDAYSDELPFEHIIDYATGENPETFRNDMAKSSYATHVKSVQKSIADFFANHYYITLVDKVENTRETIEKIVYSPSSPKEALEFLNSKDANNIVYKNHIMGFFKHFTLDEDMLMIMKRAGMKMSDLFLIDGKTVAELYGDKYKDIKNADDREWLYRMEIYKAMVLQKREIKVKTFDMGDDSVLRDTGSITLLPTKAKLESIVNNYILYKAQAGKISDYLDKYIKVLDVHKENGKEYKALMSSLKGIKKNLNNLRYEFENLPGDIEKLKKAISAFAATPEENDNPAHSANKLTALQVAGTFLDESQELVTDLVAGMKGDFLAGAAANATNEHPTTLKMDEVEKYYTNFTMAFHKSNLIKPDEVNAHLEERKQQIKARKKYADVKKKFAEKKNLTLEEVEVLNNNVSLYNSSKQMSEFDIELSKMFTHPQNDPKVMERLDILTGVPVNNTRGSSIAKVFVAWNMGYNNMSFEAAAALLNSDRVAQSIDAFFEFCKNNTIMANKHPDRAKEAAYKWAEIMKNATNRMKEYRFPDIDYNDFEAVKPYLNEFSLLKGLSVDFVQELIQRMGNCSIRSGVGTDNKEYPLRKGKDYFEEYFCSTNTLHEMEVFWRKLQVPAGLFDAAHNVANDSTFFDRWKTGSNFTLRNNMYASAVSDVCARKYLNNLKGKTIDSISRYECSLGNVLLKVNKFSGARYQSGELGEHTAAVLDYMDGTGRGPLSEVIEKDISKDVNAFTKDKLGANGIDSFIENMKFNEAEVAALLGTGDDAQAMLNFVNSSTGAANSHLNILNDMFGNFYARDTLNAVQSVGMDVLDLFRIDGKSAEELWGAKYNNYSRVEKQRCLKAEIIKAALQGEKEIKVQSIIIKDGKYLLSDLYTAIPKKADTVKFVENVTLFSAVADKMIEKLNAFHQTLKNTQRDKNANFKNNANEGSEPYQKMCKALASALYLLKNPNHDAYSMGRIQRRLKEFHEAAEFYYKRGKTSNPARLEVAREATNDIRFYVDALADINKKSDLPLFIRSGKNACVESEFFVVKRCADDLKKYYQTSAPLPEMNQNETHEKLQGVLNLKKAQYEYRMHITSAIGGVPDSSKKLSTADAAKLLTFNQYMEVASADYNTAQSVKGLKDQFSVGDFNNSVNELKNNKVFELFVKKYPRKAPYKWADALKKGSDIVNECRASLKSLNTLQSDIKDYVLDDSFKLTAKKNHKQKDRYDRLGEVIAKQIIIDPHNKSVPQAIGAGLVSYKDIVKACTDSLRKDNVLAYDNPAFSPENLQERITDGSLKAEVLNKISSQFTNKMKQEAKKQEPETQNAPRQTTAGPAV